MSLTQYRYQLLPYTGPASRLNCPDCGNTQRRTFAPYLDTRNGEILSSEYGRCNREEACGYHRSPYHLEADGLSYKERLYQQSRLTKGDTSTRVRLAPLDTPLVSTSMRTLAERRQETPPAAPLTLPAELLEQSMGRYAENRFAQLLRNHFGAAVADELLQRFQIGTSSHWPGACVFWLVDTLQRVRGGQVVQFDAQGHTAKVINQAGEVKRRTSWVHTSLAARYQRRYEPLPEWLSSYIDKAAKSPCLFGLSQLATTPALRPVAIVEAPKTAVLCTPYFPEFTWLAVLGLSYLNADRLRPLHGRSIVLYPDASESGKAYAEWSTRAKELRRQGFRVEVSALLEQRATQEQRQQGIDLADLLLTQWAGYPPNWDEAQPSPVNNND